MKKVSVFLVVMLICCTASACWKTLIQTNSYVRDALVTGYGTGVEWSSDGCIEMYNSSDFEEEAVSETCWLEASTIWDNAYTGCSGPITEPNYYEGSPGGNSTTGQIRICYCDYEE